MHHFHSSGKNKKDACMNYGNTNYVIFVILHVLIAVYKTITAQYE